MDFFEDLVEDAIQELEEDGIELSTLSIGLAIEDRGYNFVFGYEGAHEEIERISQVALDKRKDWIMSTDIKQDELLTVKEVAEILRVDIATVTRWIKQGALEVVPLPHKGKRQVSRIKKSTLEKLLGESDV